MSVLSAVLLLLGCVTRTELETALDRDGDGYLPLVADGPDCDETNAEINPDATEICGDDVDNDCDGRIDDDGIGALTWYRDADGDGWGVEDTTTACSEPEGYAPSPGDCDDGDAARSPSALDLCDGVDQNCDGVTDDDGVFQEFWPDVDGDGIGDVTGSVLACVAPAGFVLQTGDCADGDATVQPGAADLCDGSDQDCDGAVDEDATFADWYPDFDGDGVGDATATARTCDGPPVDHIAVAGDCDDGDAGVVLPIWYLDGDSDGVGGSEQAFGCEAPPQHVAVTGDCDDGAAAVSPLAVEVCENGVDDDCDAATFCGFEGFYFPEDADLTLTLPLGVLPFLGLDLGADGALDYVEVSAEQTRVWVDSDAVEAMGRAPDAVLDEVCEPVQGVSASALFCRDAAETLRVYGVGALGAEVQLTVTGVEPERQLTYGLVDWGVGQTLATVSDRRPTSTFPVAEVRTRIFGLESSSYQWPEPAAESIGLEPIRVDCGAERCLMLRIPDTESVAVVRLVPVPGSVDLETLWEGVIDFPQLSGGVVVGPVGDVNGDALEDYLVSASDSSSGNGPLVAYALASGPLYGGAEPIEVELLLQGPLSGLVLPIYVPDMTGNGLLERVLHFQSPLGGSQTRYAELHYGGRGASGVSIEFGLGATFIGDPLRQGFTSFDVGLSMSDWSRDGFPDFVFRDRDMEESMFHVYYGSGR